MQDMSYEYMTHELESCRVVVNNYDTLKFIGLCLPSLLHNDIVPKSLIWCKIW